MRRNRMNQTGGAGGFTLLEVLLAIGVLTFVAVAISQIFGSIGDTLNRGKRISELNQFASRIESVMRRDFENLSRDGFLVIRNEYAIGDGTDASGSPDGGVSLFDGDADPRPRRVDQIMFFAEGDYTSSRSDIYAGLTPKSNEARIYYGHGQRRSSDYAADSPYLKPDLRDNMLDNGMRLGQGSLPGVPNPNEYASDWTLLRHVTVLAPPASGLSQVLPDYQNGGLYGYNADRDAEPRIFKGRTFPDVNREAVQDNAYQVSLQPAITSIFWNAQVLDNQVFQTSNPFFDPDRPPPPPEYIKLVPNPVLIGFGNSAQQIANARFSSGLVDVATTSLAQIQSIVSAAAFEPNEFDSGLVNRTWMYRYLRTNFSQEALNTFPEAQGELKRYPFSVSSPAQQRAWMINALPVHPAERRDQLTGQPNAEIADPRQGQATSPRIRYETIPPDLAGSFTDAGGNQSNTTKRLINAYAAANQEMLTRSIFVPRCTEFIVDWSFGEVFDNYSGELGRQYPDLERVELMDSLADLGGNPDGSARGRARWKKFVWYGRDGWTLAPDGKQADLDGDGDRDYDEDDRTTFFYDNDIAQMTQNVEDAMERFNSSATSDPLINQYTSQEFAIEMAKAEARNPDHFLGTPVQKPEDESFDGRRTIVTTTFGYYVYDPGVITQNFRDDLVINWPWPRLIRVTFKLADPNDPGIETAYQVVFEVPSRESD